MPKEKIPTVSIADLTSDKGNADYVILDTVDFLRSMGEDPLPFSNFSQNEDPSLANDLPYRSDYYALGVCFQGEAMFRANLHSYHIKPGALLIVAPEAIKQWSSISPNHVRVAILFKKDYFLMNSADPNLLDSFSFFRFDAPHVCFLTPQQLALLGGDMKVIKEASLSDNVYKDDIVRNLLHALLYSIADIYEKSFYANVRNRTRQEVIFSQFQHLVGKHIKTERALPFYATKLHVTAKHLSETIKEVSGKTARQWINEAVTLEAKVLLQDKLLTIGQVAELLSFPDQSSFGKFFKAKVGYSPSALRATF